ncbi:hypothetical protein B0H15DRAFT_798834 [Mycena belliarum]|uniref:GmrSD restriction endonucleases N-terminal domain-containing protein n=1 Tax=Mycena belliarum TaxID=1033014 RepID=A0AAD6U877_9AGAR|nr:hypothetical protein B0H15DRAFT_798834 [Mycena belliae]
MNSPLSLDRESNTSPRPLPTTASPPKPEYEGDDDGYASDNEAEVNDESIFSIKGELVMTIGELHSLIHEGTIDLNPPYQRDVVWPVQKQAGLIDSLFRNIYINPVIFALTVDEDGVPMRTCVDGKQASDARCVNSWLEYILNIKQRLTSIQRFLDGQLPYIKSKKAQFYYTSPESTKGHRLQIPESRKKEFVEKEIVCVVYDELTPALEREIFQRVQLGMQLTTAEKLAAVDSPWARWINTLDSRHVSLEGGLGTVLDWDTRRGREFQNVAQFVYCCDGYPDAHNVPTAPKMETWLSRKDDPGERFKQDIDRALDEFGRIVADSRLNWGFAIGKKLAPVLSFFRSAGRETYPVCCNQVEFVFIGVLIYVLRDATPFERASAIYNLRVDIRAQFIDIRLNSKVGAALWGVVNQLKHSPTTSTSGAEPPVTSAPKRKRRMSADSDYYPSGKTPKGRSKR